eukprot:14238920-Heterocapsa_arctica.AAC.1
MSVDSRGISRQTSVSEPGGEPETKRSRTGSGEVSFKRREMLSELLNDVPMSLRSSQNRVEAVEIASSSGISEEARRA